MDLALADKLVEKSGSWFNYGDTRLGQGRENAKQFLRDNPDIVAEITQKVLSTRVVADHPHSPSNNGEAESDADLE
jgi:recombination protein RecA